MSLVLRDVAWTWADGNAAVRGVSIEVRPGEKVLLTGPSGCGKSTLLRRAAGLLPRFGRGTGAGTVAIGGRDPATEAPSSRAALVGLVGQDPGDQIVTGTLGDEVAFGPESAGWPAKRIEARVAEMLAAVDLTGPERDPRTLSGGQQQRLVVAASLATGAPVLLLDEPLAALDPAGARDLLARLDSLARTGTAILLVEHRLEACLGWADRVVWMEAGAVRHDGPAEDLSPETLRAGGLRVPDLWQVEHHLRARGRTLREAGLDPLRPGRVVERVPVPAVSRTATPAPPPSPKPPPPRATPGPAVLTVRGASHRYGAVDALHDVSFEACAGERIAILGGNGAGKSTLLAAIAGDLGTGHVHAEGRVVAVPQDPDLSLFCATVADEIAYGPREAGTRTSKIVRRVTEIAVDLDLMDVLPRAPQALSRGQRLRVAVAAALACDPAVLLLDEPTAGQDEARVDALMSTLTAWAGVLVFATHDVRLALRVATRILVLANGRLVADTVPAALPSALPPGPVTLPPLAALCAERGLPPLDPASFAGRWT